MFQQFKCYLNVSAIWVGPNKILSSWANFLRSQLNAWSASVKPNIYPLPFRLCVLSAKSVQVHLHEIKYQKINLSVVQSNKLAHNPLTSQCLLAGNEPFSIFSRRTENVWNCIQYRFLFSARPFWWQHPELEQLNLIHTLRQLDL